MPTDDKKFAPAAERNREAIAEVLRKVLPAEGTILEVASGTGQHARFFAELFPHLRWQPSDMDPQCLSSIAAWAEGSSVLPPLCLDVASETWPIATADAVLSINLIHIAPWKVALKLVSKAAELLPDGGALVFYGPFFVKGLETAPSNLEFDASLRARDFRWGVRQLEQLQEIAQEYGFFLQDRFPMPANNFTVVFRKKPTQLVIRPLGKKDEPQLGDLLVRAFVDTYAEKMPEVVMTDRRRNELRDFEAKNAKGLTLVAENQGKVVGTVFIVRPGGKDTLAWRQDAAEIKHLAVIPEFRHSGISEALMERSYSVAREWGAKGICLHVRRGAHGVARYYEKQGFHREPQGDFDRLPEVFLQAYYKGFV